MAKFGSNKDELGTRMKTFYEQIPKIQLMRRTPVIIRIDGKAFHTFTRGFREPFDDVLIKTMQETTEYLCANIQGCVLGYCQSDEISLLLVDYEKLDTDAWFNYEIQKMCSIAASIATMAFNKLFRENVDTEYNRYLNKKGYEGKTWEGTAKEFNKLFESYDKALNKGAMFDARVFNIPKEEVTNYFYWRQLDASRNSVLMAGQANFSHKELMCKSCNEVQDMLMLQKGINWNDYETHKKRGTCIIKWKPSENCHGVWKIDKEIPIFKGEGREYIDNLVKVGNTD